jgi:hypothetical protein
MFKEKAFACPYFISDDNFFCPNLSEQQNVADSVGSICQHNSRLADFSLYASFYVP